MTTVVKVAVKKELQMKAKKAKVTDPVVKKLPTGFQEEADRMSESQLRDCIVQSETNIKSAFDELEGNDKLQGARAIIKDIMGPFNDAKKTQQAKIAYCLRLMEEKGILTQEDE